MTKKHDMKMTAFLLKKQSRLAHRNNIIKQYSIMHLQMIIYFSCMFGALLTVYSTGAVYVGFTQNNPESLSLL